MGLNQLTHASCSQKTGAKTRAFAYGSVKMGSID